VVEHGDDGGARHGAEHRSEPAQNDHDQEVNGQKHVESIGREKPHHEGEEPSRHPCVERRQHERDRLVGGRVDTTGLRRDLARADGQESASRPRGNHVDGTRFRSEEHTSELQSLTNLVCRLLLEKKKNYNAHAEPAPTVLPSVKFEKVTASAPDGFKSGDISFARRTAGFDSILRATNYHRLEHVY